MSIGSQNGQEVYRNELELYLDMPSRDMPQVIICDT